jgi:hypothetical protein
MARRGRHQSTCSAGKRTIKWLEGLPGVTGTSLSITHGGKSIGKDRPVGFVKLQRSQQSRIKGILMCSYGAQEIVIYAEPEYHEAIRQQVIEEFGK